LSLFLSHPATTETYPLSLHDALPIYRIAAYSTASSRAASRWSKVRPRSPSESIHAARKVSRCALVSLSTNERGMTLAFPGTRPRSEEHTSELQSRENLVCRLLLEKKK